MDILVSGSLAYDRIMDYSGRFADHLMPDQLHNINVSFMVNGLKEKFGGTAGNIAYALSMLGEHPRILAAIGRDHQRYFEWLERYGLGTGTIKVIDEEFTASAFITTDADDNQITQFNPGAMFHPCGLETSGINDGSFNPGDCIAIVAPGNLQDMSEYPSAYKRLGVFCIFDPGQSLPAWDGEDLARTIAQADMLISNEYELEMITSKTGLNLDQLLTMVASVITTKGAHGTEVLTPNEATSIPVVPTDNAVDPTGAGDAFRGGLIKGMVLGYPLVRAAQMGTVCAHYVVQQYGTQEYNFTLEEFTAKLEEHFGLPPVHSHDHLDEHGHQHGN
jgi:adenosine kinase